MIKYTDTEVVFREFPDEITLAINISNCPIHCKGCHSPELWDDIGEKLTYTKLELLVLDLWVEILILNILMDQLSIFI